MMILRRSAAAACAAVLVVPVVLAHHDRGPVPHDECLETACRACPHPSGLTHSDGTPTYVFLWQEPGSDSPPPCYCDKYDCPSRDGSGGTVTVAGDLQNHCAHPCPPSEEAEAGAQAEAQTISIMPQPSIQLATSIEETEEPPGDPSVTLAAVQQQQQPQPQPSITAVSAPLTVEDPNDASVTLTAVQQQPQPSMIAISEPLIQPMPILEAEKQDYIKCPCPQNEALSYLVKTSCSEEGTRERDCQEPIVTATEIDIPFVQEPIVGDPHPEIMPAVMNQEVDPEADAITIVGGNFGVPSTEEETPEITATEIVIDAIPFVECPCPHNDIRIQNGQEELFYVTHVNIDGGEECPVDGVSFDICPPVAISMVSPNPPMMCPCPNNPDEWFQGYTGLKECEDGPDPGECMGGAAIPTVAHLEEVDCQCPFHDDDGEVAWYKIDPSHLIKDDEGDEMCPDVPPQGEGEECPPDPKFLGPPGVLDEGNTPNGPPPGKGPEGGPPGRSGGGPPPGSKGAAKKAEKFAVTEESHQQMAHEVTHVVQQQQQGQSKGAAKKAARDNDDEAVDIVGLIDEKTAATAAHHQGPCSNAPTNQAYAVCDKFCVRDGCPEVLERRRLLPRRRRYGLRSSSASNRKLKTAMETCEQLERKYEEITRAKLDCNVI